MKNTPITTLLSVLCCAAAFLPYPKASAAVLTWGSPTNISNDSDVSTTGTLFFASNLGNGSSSSANFSYGPATGTTINGVLFAGNYLNTMTTSPGLPLSTQAGFSPISINDPAAGLTMQYTNNTTFGTGTAYTSLSSSYQDLLGQGVYTDTAVSTTLTFSSLTINQTYEFQWWTNDSRTLAAAGRTVTATAGNSLTLDSNTSASGNTGLGQFGIGTFTADATTQAIVFNGSAGVQLSGFQLRAVPEPGTLTLAAGASFGLLAIRRRQTLGQ